MDRKKIKFNIGSIIFLGILTFMMPLITMAAHPSIWINSEIKIELQQQVTDNTIEWQSLKNWCDNEIGNQLTAGYQGMGWHKYVMNYGLCFQATGNQDYGNEGVIYLTALLRDKSVIGDGQGGATAIQVDSGWVARTFGAGVGIGRDWLDGATTLTPTLIQECADRLNDWIVWYDANGYGKTSPADNYYAGYFTMKYSAGISMAEDTAQAVTWRNDANNMWSSICAILNSSLQGGDWQEGWNYGPWATRQYMQYPLAIYTYTGDNTKWNDTNYYNELVQSRVHLLHPSRKYTDDDGSWSGSFKGDPRRTTLMYLIKSAPINNNEKGIAKWYTQNLLWETGAPNKWEEMLFRNTVIPIVPTGANFGLTYFMPGTSRLVTRSSEWTNTMSTFISFAVPPSGTTTEGEMNIGEYKIASREERLIVDSDTWEYASKYSNTIRVSGAHTYAPNQEWWRDIAQIDRHEDSNGVVYARGVGMESAYDGVTGNNPSLINYRREMVFVRPDYIFIYDNIVPTSESANTVVSRFHTMNNPVINDNNVIVTNNNARLFASIRGHEVIINKVDTNNTLANTWRVDVAPTATAANYKLLQVMETADASKESMDEVVDVVGTGVFGVKIGNQLVLFNSADTEDDLMTGSYTANATNTVITGLPVNSSVEINRNGTSIAGSPFDSGDGGFISFTTPVGSANYTIGNTIVTIRADVDQSGGVNSTDALLTLRNSLGLEMSGTNWQSSSTTGEVNCDGNSNSTDALLILRSSLGLEMSGTGWCVN